MPDVIHELPIDRTGTLPGNLVTGEEHILKETPGIPYKIVTLKHGGFYVKKLRVYDTAYKPLKLNVDYIVSYVYQIGTDTLGQEVCGIIVFLDPARTGTVFVSAQMVGGDLCYSFTTEEDYVKFYKTRPQGYIPVSFDYIGSEPYWRRGELTAARWSLDTYQPFNNAIEDITKEVDGSDGQWEDDFRSKVQRDAIEFLTLFGDRLNNHIADKNNPHVDTKASSLIGLDRVMNWALATPQEAIDGVANDRYMSPYLTGLSVKEWAEKPLRTHTADRQNPHRVSIAQTGANTNATVDNAAAVKYLRNELTENSNNVIHNGVTKSYEQYYADVRTNIPAGNFIIGGTNGYLPPVRMGGGAPDGNTVLMSDGIWTNFNALIEIYNTQVSPTVYILSATQYQSSQEAHNLVVVQPWAWNAPEGSLCFYYVSYIVWVGIGNGAIQNGYKQLYCSIKTNGGWVMI